MLCATENKTFKLLNNIINKYSIGISINFKIGNQHFSDPKVVAEKFSKWSYYSCG